MKESLNENKNYIKYKIKERDNYITEENTLCEIFNDYFINVGKNMAEKNLLEYNI